MTKSFPLALTYDDVLLVPQRSKVEHRSDTDTSSYLTAKIKLNIPLLSANMDTVTEAPMAIAMAKTGGLGIIHRFMSIDNQIKQVDKVKRHQSFLLKKPYTVSPNKPIRHLIDKINIHSVSSYLVINQKNQLQGLVTKRDIIFQSNLSQPVSKIMTPLNKLITVKPGITQNKARKLFKKHKIEKLPVIDKNNIVKSLITAKSVYNNEQNTLASKDKKGRLLCGGAVGVVGDYLERAQELIKANVDVIVVDVAHGQNQVSLKAIKALRKKFPKVQIIGGNVATASGAKDLIRAGVNTIKVGIGPGGICSTRIVTGVGIPQLSAIIDCVQAVKNTNIKIIADGGTNFPGDITKALAAGASTIMLAGWFAGTNESPGEIIIRNNKRYKIHRGSASFMSQADANIKLNNKKQLNTIIPEGVESLIEYKGHVAEIIYQLLGGLRSGMSYCNAFTIKQLQKNAKFIRMTSAGFRESKTHNIIEI